MGHSVVLPPNSEQNECLHYPYSFVIDKPASRGPIAVCKALTEPTSQIGKVPTRSTIFMNARMQANTYVF